MSTRREEDPAAPAGAAGSDGAPAGDLFERAFERAAIGMALVAPDGRWLRVNDAGVELFGYPRDELLAKDFQSITHPEDLPKNLEAFKRTLAGEIDGYGFEKRYLHKSGRVIFARLDVTLVRDATGGPRFFISQIQDITARKLAEDEREELRRALDRQARLYDAVLKHLPEGAVLLVDRELRHLSVQGEAIDAVFARTKLRADQVLGRTVEEVASDDGRARVVDVYRRALAGERLRFELQRESLVFDVHVVPVFDASGAIWAALLTCYDITERKKVETTLRLHSQIVSTMAEGVTLVYPRDGRILFTNRKLDQILGYEPGELEGQPIDRILLASPGDAEITAALQTEVERRADVPFERRLRRKDGSSIWVRGRLSLLPHAELGDVRLAVCEDITEKKEMEARLLLADRMASVGRLAAGLAHEINNPLAYVVANLEMLAEDLAGARRAGSTEALAMRLPDLEGMVEEARQGADRVRKIVRSVRTFSRVEEDLRAPCDVNVVLAASIKMAENEIRHRARLVRHSSETRPVLADEGRLGQAFTNLLVNAVQAIAEGDVDKNEIRVTSSMRRDDHVVVTIEDTGQGIPEDIVGRIFDPFFTTKAIGEGTGLGLAICHGIVVALGGTIEVESKLGRGSIFRVVLPVAGHVPPAVVPVVAPAAAPELRGKVLVIDDEPMVAKTIVRLLREHDVTVALGGREALAILDADSSFDLVLCDVMMPGFGGPELHAELAQRAPEVARRIVFMTGGAFSPAARAFLDAAPNERLEKPFSVEALRALARRFVRGPGRG